MRDDCLIQRAALFARHAHQDQKRKYTGEPYYVHCQEVARIVASVGGTPEMIAAAFLHDTVEDCAIPLNVILDKFGETVAQYVESLTDVSKPEDGNRARRKDIDLQHTARACPEAKTIKLADLISNTKSIVERDPHFAKVYLREKEKLLYVLTEGNPVLYNKAADLLIQGMISLMESK